MKSINLNPATHAVTFWKKGKRADRDELLARLDQLGLSKFAPAKRTELACLREAVNAVCKDDMIVPLNDKSGFAVVDQSIEEGEAKLVGSAWGKIKGIVQLVGTDPKTIACHPPDQQGEILTAFFDALSVTTGEQASTMLVGIVKHLGGATLREDGGVYWVPNSGLAAWSDVAKMLAETGVAQVYLIRHELDADAARAVIDAVIAETTKHIETIQAAVNTGELGVKALEGRQSAAEAILDRVKMYEHHTGANLAELTKQIEELEVAIGMAAIQLGAAIVEEVQAC